jgi:hypothetical protein
MSSKNGEERFPDDVQHVADLLREQRPELEPLELDRIKLRAMSAGRPAAPARRGLLARSRVTAVLTAGFLVVGTGGALALCGGTGFYHGGNGQQGGGNAGYEEQKNCGPHSYKPCPKAPPPPPNCKKGYALSGYKCVPPPPPPPQCKKGYQLSGYKCVPPLSQCKKGYQLSGYKCVPPPPPPPPVRGLKLPKCIKTVIHHNKIVVKGQKGCGVIYEP